MKVKFNQGGIEMKIIQAFLTPNVYSRPQKPLEEVTHIVIHWVGNPGSTAMANRNYFESLKNGPIYASAHYIIGLQGEIIQCIPESEIAYHAGPANSYSIGIENCHPTQGGKFNSATYVSLISLCANICKRYKLDPEEALIRHYDVTGKLCPKYYVEYPNEWKQLKEDVKKVLFVIEEDQKLIEAVKALITAGIQLDLKVWGNMKTMNMSYVKQMVGRIGKKYQCSNYKETINFLVSKECIKTREPWDKERFRPEWCRQLIINVKEKLLK